MSDVLIGVVVGGLIAWVAPLLTLRYTERRWRFEAKMNYLKSERDRFEMLYERNLERFAKGIAENSYSSVMSAEIFALMPKEISDLYEGWMAAVIGDRPRLMLTGPKNVVCPLLVLTP